jgi:uncharacterized protein (TIGR00369 family)
MSGKTDQSAVMNATRSRAHCHCIVCSPTHDHGLNVQFEIAADGSVETRFDCSRTYQGYDDVLHGGIIATLLDSAMVHCLFAHGRRALTAELNIRFREPVLTDCPAEVRARIQQEARHITILQSELIQDGRLKVVGTGKFMEDNGRPHDEVKR